MESQYVAFRFGAKITILGTGHYLAPGARGGDFCCDNGALSWSPLKHTVWFWSPTLAAEDFMFPPLSSQPPQKGSVTICKQVASILKLTSHEPWTTTSSTWSSDINWIVRKGLLLSSKSLKTKSLTLSFPHCRILRQILHPLISRHFHLWQHTTRLCSQTLCCFGNNDME